MNQGKFIVFYGINRTGKSKQVELLINRLAESKINAEPLKYPDYNLFPTGRILDNYLRKGLLLDNGIRCVKAKNFYNLSPREFQIIQSANRYQYQQTLTDKLNHRVSMISEDYTGTGQAWGIAAGVNESFLKFIDAGLVNPDMEFLFDGNQFSTGKEENHTHESNNELTERSRLAHKELGRLNKWITINPNRPQQEIHEEIFSYVKELYKGRLKFYLGMPIASNNGTNEREGELIGEILKKHGDILDSHVLDPNAYEKEAKNEEKGINIYERDMDWLMNADLAIFEATVPSTGIGREIERARMSGIPTLVLFNGQKQKRPTRMVLHDKLVQHRIYNYASGLSDALEDFIKEYPCYIND